MVDHQTYYTFEIEEFGKLELEEVQQALNQGLKYEIMKTVENL